MGFKVQFIYLKSANVALLKNIFEDTSFLEKCFYKLLVNTQCELKNRYTYIDNVQKSSEEISVTQKYC